MRNKYAPGIFLVLLFLYSSFSFAQNINPDILQKRWSATWLSVPDESPGAYEV
ncbi:MAG: hypothetical protein M3Q05_15295 [Bacteroidota bacterium]|nr:hypothetical protein [Bacteroidota bacterium]